VILALIRAAPGGIVRRRVGGSMRWKTWATLALLLLPGGCGTVDRHPAAAHPCRCPAPVHYSAAQLNAIEKAREALPRSNILQQVLVDYENERDDLRFCRGTEP